MSTVVLSATSGSLVPRQSLTLTATPRDASGAVVAGAVVTWAVQPGSVATVENGTVTGVAAGTATVSATAGGRTASTQITVRDGGLVTASGGTAATADGRVQLSVPAQAVSSATAIGITPAASPPDSPSLVPGTLFEFTPDGTAFAQPATMRIAFDPAALPTGVDPQLLALYTRVSDRWALVANSTVDVAARVVTAPVSHFSLYGACYAACLPLNQMALDITGGSEFRFELDRGGQAQTTFEVAGRNYTGPVSWVVGATPAGLSVTASPGGTREVGGQRRYDFVVRVEASPAFAAGIYSIPITARGIGVEVTKELVIVVRVASYAITAPAVSIAQGRSGTQTITLTRANFTGAVTLAVVSAPPGVTASLAAPATTTGSSASLAIAVDESVSTGDHLIMVRGTAANLPDVTAPLPLVVTPSTTPGFSIVGTPNAVTVAPNSSAGTGIRVTRTGGFSGGISWSVSGLPAGVSAAVVSTAVIDSLRLVVTAGPQAVAGTYAVSVSAVAGSLTRSLPVSLTVAASGSTVVRISVACSSAPPIFFAWQDGSGPWQALSPVAGVYTFTLTAARGAYVRVNGAGTSTSFTYGTREELVAIGEQSCTGGGGGGAGGARTVSASVSGLGANFANISYGGRSTQAVQNGASVQIAQALSGPQDLVAFRYSGVAADERLILRRAVDIPNGGAHAPIDFASTEAVVPTGGTITVGGGTSLSTAIAFTNAARCSAWNLMRDRFSQPASFFGVAVPAALMQAGDFHLLTASESTRSVSRVSSTLSGLSTSLGAPIPAVSVSSSMVGGYKRANVMFVLPADYSHVQFNYTDAAFTRSVTHSLSTAYGGSLMQLDTPDLTPLGYNPAWGITSAGPVSAGIAASSRPITEAPLCQEGYTVRRASWTGVF